MNRLPNDPEPDAFRSFLSLFLALGVGMVLCSMFTAFMLPTDSTEFVLSMCNIGIGLALIGGVALVLRVLG